MSTAMQTHKLTDPKTIGRIHELMGIATIVEELEASPSKALAGMALAIAISTKCMAERKVSVYQSINRDLARAGIDIGKLTVIRISGTDSVEYELGDLVDEMETHS